MQKSFFLQKKLQIKKRAMLHRIEMQHCLFQFQTLKTSEAQQQNTTHLKVLVNDCFKLISNP